MRGCEGWVADDQSSGRVLGSAFRAIHTANSLVSQTEGCVSQAMNCVRVLGGSWIRCRRPQELVDGGTIT